MDDLRVKPEGHYKFASVELGVNPTMVMTGRQTYHVLDWLGDIGGFTDALMIINSYALLPFSKFHLAALLLTSLFRFQPSQKPPPAKKSPQRAQLARKRDA